MSYKKRKLRSKRHSHSKQKRSRSRRSTHKKSRSRRASKRLSFSHSIRRSSSARQTSRKYARRPSPPYKANEYCGQIMTGNNGLPFISKQMAGSHNCRWIPYDDPAVYNPSQLSGETFPSTSFRASLQPVEYITLDNGGQAFKVRISGNEVIASVYGEHPTLRGKEVFRSTAERIFAGDPPRKEWRGSYYTWKDGTSLILHMGGDKYVFIGEWIYEWNAMKGDTIRYFYTPVGNSGVPYPFAVGDHYIYLLTADKVVLDRNMVDLTKQEPYRVFWELSKQKQKQVPRLKHKKLVDGVFW